MAHAETGGVLGLPTSQQATACAPGGLPYMHVCQSAVLLVICTLQSLVLAGKRHVRPDNTSRRSDVRV
jgi:hypothetical protein